MVNAYKLVKKEMRFNSIGKTVFFYYI